MTAANGSGPATRLPLTGKRRRRGTRNVLPLLAGMFLASALIRVGDGAGRALATGAEDRGAEAAEPAPAGCTPDAGAAALLDALRERDAQLAERDRALSERERALDLARTEIDRRLERLAEAEEALARTVSTADQAAEKDIARLVTVYENMKPKEAAPLFQEMDPEFAAGFLARMRPDAAAAVLSGVDPKSAYAISAILAGRNAKAPRN